MQEIRGVRLENLYWMLAYAWDQFEPARTVAAHLDRAGAPMGGFAACFLSCAERLVRQGFFQAFVRRSNRLCTVRGRILVSRTVRDGSHERGQLVCDFERPSIDVLPNRIIRTALRRIVLSDDLDPSLRKRARSLDRRFEGVQVLSAIPRDFSVVGAGVERRGYRFVLYLARFILTELQPVGVGGKSLFLAVDVERVIHDVFERFLRSFLSRNQYRFGVSRVRRAWFDTVAENEAASKLLPEFVTDIVLREPRRTIVIDAKFYARTLREHRGIERAREAHLYQLLGYLHNMKRAQIFGDVIEGVLVYPRAEQGLDACWTIHGYPVRLCTVDLSQPWPAVAEEVLSLANRGGRLCT